MVDYRRIFYLLKSPDFVRKVGGHAPDYPQIESADGRRKKISVNRREINQR
jgi:hypothetical protein